MGKAQRVKGHSWERAVARAIRAALKLTIEQLHRGQQSRSGTAQEADVEGAPFYIECKAGSKRYVKPLDALVQAEAAAKKRGDKRPGLAVCKVDRVKPFVVMRMSTFLDLIQDKVKLDD